MPNFKILINPQDRYFLGQVRIVPSSAIPVWTEWHEGALYALSTDSRELFELWCTSLRAEDRWHKTSH